MTLTASGFTTSSVPGEKISFSRSFWQTSWYYLLFLPNWILCTNKKQSIWAKVWDMGLARSGHMLSSQSRVDSRNIRDYCQKGGWVAGKQNSTAVHLAVSLAWTRKPPESHLSQSSFVLPEDGSIQLLLILTSCRPEGRSLLKKKKKKNLFIYF